MKWRLARAKAVERLLSGELSTWNTATRPGLVARIGPPHVDQTDANNGLPTAILAPPPGDNIRDDAALKQHADALSWDIELAGTAFVGLHLAAGVFSPAQSADACRAWPE